MFLKVVMQKKDKCCAPLIHSTTVGPDWLLKLVWRWGWGGVLTFFMGRHSALMKVPDETWATLLSPGPVAALLSSQ